MSFFSNKHVVTAMVVAPILAVLSYYLVDIIVSERPSAAVKGQSYPLNAKSNCRYTSGACDLNNADFRSRLAVFKSGGREVLELTAAQSLQDVKVGFSSIGKEPPAIPLSMEPTDGERKIWSIQLPVPADEQHMLVIAILSNGSHYYAETTMGFAEYKTSFDKDFTQN